MYVWGGRPEERAKIGGVLRGREGEEVALVDVGGRLGLEVLGAAGWRGVEGGGEGEEQEEGEEEEEEEEEGILDLGVGESHILVLTTRGKVYAVGEGKWGQLGTGSRKYESEWVEVQVSVPVPDGGTGQNSNTFSITNDVDDVDNTAVVEGEVTKRPGWNAREEKSTRDHHHQPRRKIIGVECGFWNSFLLVSVVG